MKGDAEVVGDELLRIADVYGAVTAPIVLKAARSKQSPIHNQFDWTDAVAAEKWRLSQAGQLIRAVVLTPSTGEAEFKSVRLMVAVGETAEKPATTYIDVREAMKDDNYREEVLARARRELATWRQRYGALQAFASLHKAIDAALVAGG